MMLFLGLSTLLASLVSTDAQCLLSSSLFDVAQETPELSTLVSLINDSGLAPVVGTDGTYTVFAPVNSAFEKLPADTLENYSGEDLLKYHVLGEEVVAEDLSMGLTKTTLLGKSITFTSLDPVMINNAATVTSADTGTCNGILHLIDTVLIPPSGTDDFSVAPTNAPVSYCTSLTKKACKKSSCCKFGKSMCKARTECDDCAPLKKKKCKKQECCVFKKGKCKTNADIESCSTSATSTS